MNTFGPMKAMACPNAAPRAGSPERFARIPNTWQQRAPPIQTIAAEMWTNSQSS